MKEVFYIIPFESHDMVKVGISGDIKSRIKNHAAYYKGLNMSFNKEKIILIYTDSSKVTRHIEEFIKIRFDALEVDKIEGYTEIYSADNYDNIVSSALEQAKLHGITSFTTLEEYKNHEEINDIKFMVKHSVLDDDRADLVFEYDLEKHRYDHTWGLQNVELSENGVYIPFCRSIKSENGVLLINHNVDLIKEMMPKYYDMLPEELKD